VETGGGERLGLFEGGLEGGVAEGDDNGRGERELVICILEICREERRAAISAVSLALAHRAR